MSMMSHRPLKPNSEFVSKSRDIVLLEQCRIYFITLADDSN